jgi:hypothetical protein
MAIQHTWSINSTFKYRDSGGTVYKVIFQLDTVDTDDPRRFSVSTMDFIELDVNNIDPDQYVTFEELTEDLVLEWVFSNIEKYNIPNTNPIQTKNVYEISHEMWIRKLKNYIEFTPDRPYTSVGYLGELDTEVPPTYSESILEPETDPLEDNVQLAPETQLT